MHFETTITIDLYNPDIETIIELFVNRTDVYAIQDNLGYRRVFGSIDEDVIATHMLGDSTIGVYQLSEVNTLTWICFDVDSHSLTENKQSLDKATTIFFRLIDYGIPFVLELSGTPFSYHFWIFTEPVCSEKGYIFGREIAGDLNIEIYPKQPKLTEDKKFGNLVKLPYGVNRKNGKWSKVVYQSDNMCKIDINMYEPTEIPEISPSPSELKYTNTVLPTTVRPCLRACGEGKIVMTGTGGHTLRCALVPELYRCADMDEHEITMQYRYQPDFDYDKTRYMVGTLMGFNRYSCKKIKSDAYHLINEYCKGCAHNV